MTTGTRAFDLPRTQQSKGFKYTNESGRKLKTGASNHDTLEPTTNDEMREETRHTPKQTRVNINVHRAVRKYVLHVKVCRELCTQYEGGTLSYT